MNKILSIALIFFVFAGIIYADSNTGQGKIEILILPFLNSSNIEKYEYLKDSIKNILSSELLKTDKFQFSKESIPKDIDPSNINSMSYQDYIDMILRKTKIFNADEIIIGQYVIKNEKIQIDIRVFDRSNQSNTASSSMKGDLGIDIFSIIEKSARDITGKMLEDATIIQKALEIDMGFGVSGFLSFNFPSSSVNEIKQSVKIDDGLYAHKYSAYNLFILGEGGEAFLPMSVIFFPQKKFGVGFTNILGASVGEYSSWNNVFELFAKTMLTVKYGSINLKKFFICEIGLNAGIDYFFGAYSYKNEDLKSDVYTNAKKSNGNIDFYFNYERCHIGPSLFMGYDRIYGKGFNYTIGGLLDIEISQNYKYDYTTNRIYNVFNYAINTGIEFRWQYCYFKAR